MKGEFCTVSKFILAQQAPSLHELHHISLCETPGFDPWVGKLPWRREGLPTPVFWPGEFHGLYSPWGRKESDTTERLSLTYFYHWCHLGSPAESDTIYQLSMNMNCVQISPFYKDTGHTEWGPT